MTATLSPLPVFQWINAQGLPLAGGKLFSYAAGTSTPLATFTDASGTVANTNPVILDSSGSAPVWLGSASYKLVLEDTFNNVIWTADNINAVQNAFLATTGGTLYQPGQATTLNINADPGLFPQIIFQLNGINSSLVSSKVQGDLTIGGYASNGTYNGDIWTFDATTSSFSGTNFSVGANTNSVTNISVNGAANTNRSYLFLTSGVNRWQIGATNSTESGSNSGTDWVFQSYADNGAFLRTVAVCFRTSGAWTFGVSISSPSITDTSDPSLKYDWSPVTLNEARKWIEALDPQWFTWKETGKRSIGFDASKVLEFMDVIVEKGDDGLLSMAYQKVVCPLVLMVRDQEERIRAIEAKLGL